MPIKLIYRFVLRYPFLAFYGILRKLKKLILFFKSPEKSNASWQFKKYAPLFIIIIFGLGISVSNLKAQDTKPTNYGQKNILYKLLASNNNYWEGDFASEETIEEGPLSSTQTAPTSYLADEAIGQITNTELASQTGINTLISTTQDESALIAPEIIDPSQIVKKRDQIIDYVVGSGDSISTIAAKFGITVNTILWENSLTLYSTIRPGQTLKILPVSGVSYKIKKGDTLRGIANTYNGEVNEIIEFNKLDSASDIQINQVVIIPDGEKKTTVAATPSYSIQNIISPPATVSNTKLQWPTNSYRITQYYSWRHTGLDVGNATGQPIYASETGKVITAGWNNSGYGYYVIIDHGNGLKTLYAHMSKILVTSGQNVERGGVIGQIGSTGRSTGPHLHFEVRVNNSRVNPLGYIR